MKFPSENGLTAIMIFASTMIFLSVSFLYIILAHIELQKTLAIDEKLDFKENVDDEKGVTSAATEEEKKESDSGAPAIDGDSGVVSRLQLSNVRRAILAATVGCITLFTYLILVLSTANPLLSWLGMAAVLGMTLRSSIFEEIRRERLDRLACIVTIVLFLAMGLSLTVYANRQHAQGEIYEGKARIVGYDYTSYNDAADETITRTDLEVAWGGLWGCPNDPEQQCQAVVNGALCESESDRRKLESKRRLDDQEIEDENNDVEEDKNEDDKQDGQEEEEDLEAENEDLKEENEELEEENEELEEELEEYEEYDEDLEEAVEYEEEEIIEVEEEEEYSYYYFDDDLYYDNYWSDQSWSTVWGDYVCEDLFDTDVDGESFDETQPPGTDEWPFINIYGNCATCEAYIVDYYSTEHFQTILSYKQAGINYGIVASICGILSMFLIIKTRLNPTAEKEIELLSSEVVVDGAMT